MPGLSQRYSNHECAFMLTSPKGRIAIKRLGCWLGFGQDADIIYSFLDTEILAKLSGSLA